MQHYPSADAIVACARSWIGTRFSHQGRLKKTDQHPGGVDCLGLLMGIARELDIKDICGTPICQRDTRDYTRTPDTTRLHAALFDALKRKPIEEAEAGDIALLTIKGSPQHLGIISTLDGSLSIIHAYAQARKVVEHTLDVYWRAQLIAVFSIR